MKLRIEKAIYGGAGLARIGTEEGELAGKTVFVPEALPGELVEADILEDKRSFANGALTAILEPSPERVIPGCEYYGRCGGCHYQHAGPAYQLEVKAAILKETLARAHIAMAADIEAIAGPAWEYRNRIRLHVVRAGGKGLGYRQRASHSLLPVTHCPIAAPLLQNAIATVTDCGVGDLCNEVELFTNAEQDQLLVSLWPGGLRTGEQDVETFAEKLGQQIPALRGVGLFKSDEISYWGQRSLTYTVTGIPYQVSLGGFFQVNRFLVPTLLKLVTERAGKKRSGRLAWDLYAGAGLFARALNYENVTAVESAGVSADDLKQNHRGRVVRAGTLEFLRNQTKAKPELIVVDPPRAGLGKEICTLLGKIAAPEIVYVSCDPATLARDLQSLLHSGYSVQTMHLLDLFPQTFHLETVAYLKQN